MKLASFDIFDTTLSRLCGTERNLFYILARKILGENADSNDIWGFVCEREKAFYWASRVATNKDISISDIYGQADFSAFTNKSNSEILNVEIELQGSLLCPIKATIQSIKKYRKEGYTIVFISDMHLPSSVLKKALIYNGALVGNEDVFVSSELGRTKSSGTLYDYVRSKYNGIKVWHHHGDDKWSDYEMAKKKGIKAFLFRQTPFLHYDNTFKTFGIEQVDCVSEISKSIARSLALKQYDTDYCHLYLDIVAPLFVSFVFDILSRAQKKGIQKILFFARDSYVLYKIAESYKTLFPNIRIEYFYVSRSTLYLPAVREISYEAFSEVKSIDGFSFEEYLKHFGIAEEEFPQIGNLKDMSGEDALKQFLSEEAIIKKLQVRRQYYSDLLCEYYKQVVGVEKKIAIVDLMGTGASLQALNVVLKRNKITPICYAFYLYIFYNKRDLQNECQYSYILSGVQLSNRHIHSMGRAIEDIFAMTNQPRTIGYQLEQRAVIPVQEKINCSWKTTYMDLNLDIFRAYTQSYINTYQYLNNEYCLQRALQKLSLFASNPLKEYSKALSHLKTTETGIEEFFIIDKPWNNNNFLKWNEGSYAVLNPLERWSFDCITQIKKMVKNLGLISKQM